MEIAMPRRTINVYYRDGLPTRVIADDTSLRDVEVNVITNDAPERVAFVAMVAEAEIERFCADQRACKSNTQWHGLSIAVEYMGECLIAMREKHYGDPVGMNAAIDDILNRFNTARLHAMDLRAVVEEATASDVPAVTPSHVATERQARKGNGKHGNGNGHKAVN
jgi:hypothetical protein